MPESTKFVYDDISNKKNGSKLFEFDMTSAQLELKIRQTAAPKQSSRKTCMKKDIPHIHLHIIYTYFVYVSLEHANEKSKILMYFFCKFHLLFNWFSLSLGSFLLVHHFNRTCAFFPQVQHTIFYVFSLSLSDSS